MVPQAEGRDGGTLTGPPVQVVTGRDPVVRVLHAADPLLASTGAPFCARAAWLSSWLDCHPDAEPVAVVVAAAAGPAGLGCLAVTRRGPVRTVVLAGDGPSDYGRLPVRDEAAAGALADGILGVLGRLAGPWRLRFAQLPPGDRVVARLAAALPGARVVAGQGCPVLAFGPERVLERHTSAERRRAARQGRIRLAEQDVGVRVERTAEATEIERLVPDIVALHRDRDHAMGRRSDLDDRARRAFYAAVLGRMAASGQAELWLLRAGGMLAAYQIGVRDGPAYRLWDGRISTAWQWARPGRVLDTAVLEALLADPTVTELDWMRGELRHKLKAATHVVATEQLQAESSPALTVADRAAQGLDRGLRRAARCCLPDRVVVRIRLRRRRASPSTA